MHFAFLSTASVFAGLRKIREGLEKAIGRDDKNQEHALTVQTTAGQDNIFFYHNIERDRENQEKFKELMKNNNTLKVVISGWDYRYNFTMNTKGFQEACDYLNE